jgi:hypothetical protein
MSTLADLPFPLVRIRARDWALSENQYRVDGKWDPIVGYISGWLIGETDDAVTVSQQLFYHEGSEAHWQTRYTITIPKETITEREDLPHAPELAE